MTGDELIKIGEVLYGGNRVASNLSHALEVSPRTVRRWLSDEQEIPLGVEEQLKQLVYAKQELLLKLLGK